jgi:hypothetical protein
MYWFSLSGQVKAKIGGVKIGKQEFTFDQKIRRSLVKA